LFKGIVINRREHGYATTLENLGDAELPAGDVVVQIQNSTLNYKDALAITGKSAVVRSFPMIPGIDLVGTVLRSDSERFAPGATVLLNGWGVGELYWGGLAQRASLKSEWLLPLPKALTARQAMEIGTAGYTAMLAVIALEQHGLTPASGEIIVTGAGGGVGGIAISLLARLGYRVIAATGRPNEADYFRTLGAADVIDRAKFSVTGKPLAKERWAGAIDSAGSHTLANICAEMRYGGIVAACGLAQGIDLPASVAPFILRGITLQGIDSVYRPLADREEAWNRLVVDLDVKKLAVMTRVIGLSEVIRAASDLLENRVRGRLVVDVNR
jgi:acrylyl-CoA reductase (NADPH)